MAETNVEVARRLFPETVDLVALFSNVEAVRVALVPLVQPDFETITVPGQVPLAGVGAEDPSRPIFRGVDGFVESFRDWLSAWESWVVTAVDFVDADENRVLVLLDVLARSKTHQVEIPIEGANLLTLRDAKLARLELFFDRDQAREEAGLLG
jgi:hypothetical protein